MKPIKFACLALLLVITAAWLLTDSLLPQPFTYFAFRSVFMQYSGTLAIAAMSVAMLLALRPKWLEPRLDGLDKMYRLHKWLAITALVGSVLHWWWARGTRWMVGWGWLVRPERRRGPQPEPGLVEGWLRGQRDLAESVGEWAFYAAVVLIILALVKRFPYHLFTRTHKWLAAAYLALVYHAPVLVKFPYWSRPVGWLLALLMLGGGVAAVLALSGRIGAGRKVRGRIESLAWYPELRVLESAVALAPGWPGHVAGQFAFAMSDPKEGPHPYTIASAWNPAKPRIVFITKALGDHTGRLRDRLEVGLPVTVEAPTAADLCRHTWIDRSGHPPVRARTDGRPTMGHRRMQSAHPGLTFNPSPGSMKPGDPMPPARQGPGRRCRLRVHRLPSRPISLPQPRSSP